MIRAASHVGAIFKTRAAAAGLADEEVEAITSHGARVGMAQDVIAAGEPLPAVMQAGRCRWPEMPSLYAERLDARRGAPPRAGPGR